MKKIATIENWLIKIDKSLRLSQVEDKQKIVDFINENQELLGLTINKLKTAWLITSFKQKTEQLDNWVLQLIEDLGA